MTSVKGELAPMFSSVNITPALVTAALRGDVSCVGIATILHFYIVAIWEKKALSVFYKVPSVEDQGPLFKTDQACYCSKGRP